MAAAGSDSDERMRFYRSRFLVAEPRRTAQASAMKLRFLEKQRRAWPWIVLGVSWVALANAEIQPGPYQLGPDSQPQPGVPQGREEKLELPTSQIFPGAEHEAWVYIPAQYDAATPASLMVFQDGGGYVRRDGQWRVPVVFDNLIHQKAMPVTIGLFINPGVLPATHENALPRFNRSFEYDGLGDRYARFLLEEVIPEVKKKYAVTDDPNLRAIGGASSGAVCSFTVAWERPDAFRRVFSTIGTYVGLRGADEYPTLIRKTEPKPLRIFLQDGDRDLNIYGGDWWMANQTMHRALVFAGYEVKQVWGDGGHDGQQGSAVLPDALRWLWQGWPEPLKANTQGASQQPMKEWCELGAGWEKVSDWTSGSAASLTVDRRGAVYVAVKGESEIKHISPEGAVTAWRRLPAPLTGSLSWAGDDFLWALTRNGVIGLRGEDTVVPALGKQGVTHVLPTAAGGFYGAVSSGHQSQGYYVPPTPDKSTPPQVRLVFEISSRVTALALSPDHSLLYVAAADDRFIHSYQIRADGSLAHGQRYFHLHVHDELEPVGPQALSVDAEGRLYAATPVGVQIFDQAGRANAILPLLSTERPTSMTFGGPNLTDLYVATTKGVYRRPMKVRGVRSIDAPHKPKPPRL